MSGSAYGGADQAHITFASNYANSTRLQIADLIARHGPARFGYDALDLRPGWCFAVWLERQGMGMARLGRFILWLFIAPGDILSDRLGVSIDQNRDLVRMLFNSLFWILIVIIGLAIWTSRMPAFR